MSELQHSDVGAATVSSLTQRLVPFLFLLYVVAYLDRINVGFAAARMQEQLGFIDAEYGLGAGLFFAGYFVFQIPSNLILQQVGAKRWISILMIAWGMVSSSTAFVSTPRSFYLLRFLLGLAEAGFFPGVILYLKNWFPAGAQARTVAWFMAAGPLSGVLGGPISGSLLALNNRGGLSGWQWLFLLEGGPAVILGVVVFFCLTETPDDARWLSSGQRAWLVETLNRERQSSTSVARNRAFAILTRGGVWLLALVYFGGNTCAYGMSLWLPSVIHRLSGVSEFDIGWLSAIPFVATAVVMVLLGFHSDRFGERRWHVAIPAFVGACALLIAAGSASVIVLFVAMSLAMVGASSRGGPFWALANSLLGGTAAATGIALINCIGNLGGFFGPYIIGFVRTWTGEFRGGLLVVGITLGLTGFLALLVRVPTPRQAVPLQVTAKTESN